MAFYSTIGRLVKLKASLERALLDFEANLLAHISSRVVNPSTNGVVREKTCWIFFFASDPIIISAMFSAHVLISSSAITWASYT